MVSSLWLYWLILEHMFSIVWLCEQIGPSLFGLSQDRAPVIKWAPLHMHAHRGLRSFMYRSGLDLMFGPSHWLIFSLLISPIGHHWLQYWLVRIISQFSRPFLSNHWAHRASSHRQNAWFPTWTYRNNLLCVHSVLIVHLPWFLSHAINTLYQIIEAPTLIIQTLCNFGMHLPLLYLLLFADFFEIYLFMFMNRSLPASFCLQWELVIVLTLDIYRILWVRLFLLFLRIKVGVPCV